MADTSGAVGAAGSTSISIPSTVSASLSRRAFTRRAGTGAAAAAGLVWAAPKISTIRYATKVAAGSRPPMTTTATVPTIAQGGKVTVSEAAPCIGHDVRVMADGFAAGAGVAIQIDSAAHAIGLAHADASGAVDVVLTIPSTAPTGHRVLRVVGPNPGGDTVTLTTPITVLDFAHCENPLTDPGAGAEGDPAGADPAPDGAAAVAGAGTGNGGALPLTGSDAIDLAVIGGAAAIGGRVLYGLSHRGPKPLDGSDD